ncbi:MAG TPA: amidohydrolase family protein [Geminicoccus sp.]|uniref:metal-dependent hydrolase family protein n=1 Tax=Geminicoccus sp. TaxID=2024832 RepID=UPI002BEA7F03|nr:amidohydrolase family protein [Geminicoccus sp.]HWL69465.1 amidohydrolase family protein [Geminicoccus sp.]
MWSCTPGEAGQPVSHFGCPCHSPALLAASRRLGRTLSRRGFVAALGTSAAALALPGRTLAQEPPAAGTRPILLTNFRLFDGSSPQLRDGLHLLVEGERIAGLATGEATAPEGAQLLDCQGRTLMPGLIDAHWHAVLAAASMATLMTASPAYLHLAAAAEAERTLMRGFTTIRDLGGPSFALKQAIDEGLVKGPRIYPSGAMITATGGHGDLRQLTDIPRSPDRGLSTIEQMGGAAIVDSPADVRMRAREQLLQGASQIKLVASGGVSSPRSPIDLSTMTLAELRGGTEVATDWNTYATVHAYTPHTMRRAIAAGAHCIEHGHLMDAVTAKLMADNGVWLSIQPFLSAEDTVPLQGPSLVAMRQVLSGTERAYELAIEHGLKTAFGSDLLFSAEMATRQGVMLTHLTRWYGNADILRMATSANGELLALSGPRNPYPGKLGAVEPGAWADLLLVDGDPLADLAPLARPETGLMVIMKGGVIHKNTLEG